VCARATLGLTLRSYDVSIQNGGYDPLRMERLYGGYHLAFDHLRNNKKLYSQYGYSSMWRSIQVMDESDSYATITLRQMLESCGRIDPVTDEMIGIDDPQHMQMGRGAGAAGSSGERVDSFHYRDEATQRLLPIPYFGLQNPEYFTDQDYLNVGRTLVSSSDSLGRCLKDCSLDRALKTIRSSIRLMERVQNPNVLNAWAGAVAIQNAAGSGGQRHSGIEGSPPSLEGVLDWVPNAYGGLDLPVFEGNPALEQHVLVLRNNITLPPFYGSAAGLRTIRAAVLSTNQKVAFETKYGFNYEAALAISDALPLVEDLAETLARALKCSPALDSNYVSSYFHHADPFTGFVENIVWQARVPVWLRRTVVAGGGSAGASSDISPVGPATALDQLDAQEAVQELVGLSSATAAQLDVGVLGPLVIGRQTTVIQARLGVVGQGGADTVFVNAAQKDGRVDPNVLPEFARAALEDVAFRVGDNGLAAYDEAVLAEAAAAKGEDQKKIARAYSQIVRLRFNYAPRLEGPEDTDRYIASETVRACVLALVGAISMATGRGSTLAAKYAPVADRVNAFCDGFLRSQLHVDVGGAAMQGGVVSPVGTSAEVKEAVARFMADEVGKGVPEVSRVFGKKTVAQVTARLNAAEQRAAQTKRYLDSMSAQRAPASAAAAAKGKGMSLAPESELSEARLRPAARVGARIDAENLPGARDPANYVRTPLMASPEQFEAVSRSDAPNLALSDPTNVDAVATPGQLYTYGQALGAFRQVQNNSTRSALPSTLLPSHGIRGSPSLEHIAAARNVCALRDGRPRNASGLGGVNMGQSMLLAAQEERARLHEQYDDAGSARGGAGSAGRRFRSRHASAMDVDEPASPAGIPSRSVRQVFVAPSLRDGMDASLDSVLKHKIFQDNWDAVDEHAGSEPAAAAAAKAFMLTRTRGKCWRALIDNNVVFPATFIGARPFIQLEGVMFIKTLAGEQTAITWTARPVTSWGDNAQTQSYTLTVTYYAKTIVHGEKNVYLVPMVRLFACV
jgi:hypothetical protein